MSNPLILGRSNPGYGSMPDGSGSGVTTTDSVSEAERGERSYLLSSEPPEERNNTLTSASREQPSRSQLNGTCTTLNNDYTVLPEQQGSWLGRSLVWNWSGESGGEEEKSDPHLQLSDFTNYLAEMKKHKTPEHNLSVIYEHDHQLPHTHAIGSFLDPKREVLAPYQDNYSGQFHQALWGKDQRGTLDSLLKMGSNEFGYWFTYNHINHSRRSYIEGSSGLWNEVVTGLIARRFTDNLMAQVSTYSVTQNIEGLKDVFRNMVRVIPLWGAQWGECIDCAPNEPTFQIPELIPTSQVLPNKVNTLLVRNFLQEGERFLQKYPVEIEKMHLSASALSVSLESLYPSSQEAELAFQNVQTNFLDTKEILTSIVTRTKVLNEKIKRTLEMLKPLELNKTDSTLRSNRSVKAIAATLRDVTQLSLGSLSGKEQLSHLPTEVGNFFEEAISKVLGPSEEDYDLIDLISLLATDLREIVASKEENTTLGIETLMEAISKYNELVKKGIHVDLSQLDQAIEDFQEKQSEYSNATKLTLEKIKLIVNTSNQALSELENLLASDYNMEEQGTPRTMNPIYSISESLKESFQEAQKYAQQRKAALDQLETAKKSFLDVVTTSLSLKNQPLERNLTSLLERMKQELDILCATDWSSVVEEGSD